MQNCGPNPTVTGKKNLVLPLRRLYYSYKLQQVLDCNSILRLFFTKTKMLVFFFLGQCHFGGGEGGKGLLPANRKYIYTYIKNGKKEKVR